MADHGILGDRAQGWLRFTWEKATTPDDWSSSGQPRAWWDDASSPPMCLFSRFDLLETGNVLAAMSDATPAWREIYSRIADELLWRHTTFWGAVDWITLIGSDPRRDRYPPEWQLMLPEPLRGRYDAPGWTANGVEPWGLQPDPIGADGNLFFRGFFNLLLGIYRYVSGDVKWESPFPVTGYRDRQFDWTHGRIAEFLALQFAERPQGPHCENTKIWPNCVSAAGLGLLMYDVLNGTEHHGVYHCWVDFAKRHYMRFDRKGELSWWAMYYDPLEEVAAGFDAPNAGYSALETLFFLYPQDRDLTLRLYESAMRAIGWSEPNRPFVRRIRDPRLASRALLLAREFGDQVTEERLRAVVEYEFEPRRFGAERDRFGYWFGLDTQWPRGQYNACLMLAEIGEPGAWWRIFNQPNLAKFDQPTLEGVDYPTLGISQAYNDPATSTLWVRTYAATPSRRATPTTWRVTRVPDPSTVRVTCDNRDFAAVRVVDDGTIEITSDVDDHLFRVEAGPSNSWTTSARAHHDVRTATPSAQARTARTPRSTGFESLGSAPPTTMSCCGPRRGT